MGTDPTTARTPLARPPNTYPDKAVLGPGEPKCQLRANRPPACCSDDSKLLLPVGVWRLRRRWGSLIERAVGSVGDVVSGERGQRASDWMLVRPCCVGDPEVLGK